MDVVCVPFSEAEPHVILIVVFAVLTIMGQVFVLVSHSSTYTIFFYEAKVAHLQGVAAGWQRRSEAGLDYALAKRRVVERMATSPSSKTGASDKKLSYEEARKEHLRQSHEESASRGSATRQMGRSKSPQKGNGLGTANPLGVV